MKMKLLASIAALTIASAACADTAITGFSGGSLFAGIDGVPLTIGYQFTVNQALSVTSLGLYDRNYGGGSLQFSHAIGIFTTAGTLLASTTILPTSTLVNGYRYVSISPLNLGAGQTYLIGAEFQDTGVADDAYYSGTTTVTTSSAITFGQSAYRDSPTLTAPLTLTGSNGRFGPNFQFTLASATVPEPASWAMMVAGFGIAGAMMRGRRKIDTRVKFV